VIFALSDGNGKFQVVCRYICEWTDTSKTFSYV